MKNSVKFGALTLFCAAALTLAACEKQTVHTPTTVSTLPEQNAGTLSVVQLQGSGELVTILDAIQSNVFPGTAGATLNAVPYTVRLLDWCKSAGIRESELREVLSGWLQGKDAEETARQFSLIADTYAALMGDTAAELLESAGCQTDSLPWPDSCCQVMQTILEAAGAEIPDIPETQGNP